MECNKNTDDNNANGRSVILFVDDDPFLHPVVKELFSDYLVIFADNGLEALNIMQSHKVDLIITDLHMPEMNGFELAFAIKNKLKNNIPIILQTGSFGSKIKMEKSELFDAVFFKPYKFSDLRALIQQLLSKP
ncbi:response regulator [Planctomycetota bacterium]